MNAYAFFAVLCSVASAQGAAPAAPAVEVSEAPAKGAEEKALPAPSLLEEKAEKKEAEPQVEPKAEPAPEPKAEPKPEPKAEAEAPKAAAAKTDAPKAEEEYMFAKSGAEDADPATWAASMEDLRVFVRRWPESPQAPEAMLLLAGLRAKAGDWQPATTTLLRLLYEYPGTKLGLRAKSDYLGLLDKKASRRHRQALNDLVTLPESKDREDRLAALWLKVVDTAPDALYEPVAEEVRDFTVRFPAHPESDRLQAALARLHAANGKPAAAVLAWRKLLALFPASALRAKARMSIGDLYADALRDPKKAIDSYQELVEKYPKSDEVLPALEKSAELFDIKLRQYALAVEMHEKVVATFPKTPASLKALKELGRLQRERLQKPEEAIKALTRLSSMHGGPDGVEALLKAAEIARRDLKDFARQAELLRKVADDYASAKDGPQALYDAAGVYESDLKDAGKAVEVYREVASKFPSHKLAKRAEDRVAKLEAAK